MSTQIVNKVSTVAARTLTILVTCHNRKQTTLECLKAIEKAVAKSCSYCVVLVDDGSTDGTAEEVRHQFPAVILLPGDGTLYWNGGMRTAWQTARIANPEFYLWLNDDTCLRPGAIRDMINLYDAETSPKTLIVGRTIDPVNMRTTYGAYKRARKFSRLRFRHLLADEQYGDTMNGNCVLIPASAEKDVGINSSIYRHAFGDIDYGLRAKSAGYRIRELKSEVGVQSRNEQYEAAVSKITKANWRFILFHPKGIPWREWLTFCRCHGGFTWPINFIYRYIKML